MSKIIKNPTFFVDIDGTIVKYRNFSELATAKLEPIQEVIDYLNHQYDIGAVIIVTTARPENFRAFTEDELSKLDLRFHQLVMGCGRGTRVIFNDKDPENPELDRAVGINFTRDGGFQSVGGYPNIENYESE